MENILATVDTFFRDARLYAILGLILLDVVLAVAQAIQDKRFEWFRLADFYQTMVVPFILGYLALYLLVSVSIGVDQFIGQAAVFSAFATIAAHLIASIADHAKAIGFDFQVGGAGGDPIG